MGTKRMIYTGGVKLRGHVYEEVWLEEKDGVCYYCTLSMTDPMNCGGERKKVPEALMNNGVPDETALLRYIKENHPYMSTMGK